MTAKLSHRVLVTHSAPEALAPITRAILGKLGYAILTPEEFETLAQSMDRIKPDLRIVDERNLFDVPEEERPAVPIIVLTGRHGTTGADSRIVGAVQRPAGLHELYRLLQQVLEDTPRTTPRVPTHLNAHCSKNGHAWKGAVLSLSENGCLLRSPEPLLLGSRIDLSFELPRAGAINVRAEVAYQLVPESGLIFLATLPTDRSAISDFVINSISMS